MKSQVYVVNGRSPGLFRTFRTKGVLQLALTIVRTKNCEAYKIVPLTIIDICIIMIESEVIYI